MLSGLRNLVNRGQAHARRLTNGAEIGWGGAKVFSGIVLDEYNPDLKGKLALLTAEKMRRTSGQVRSVERVFRLPGSGSKSLRSLGLSSWLVIRELGRTSKTQS